MLGFADFDVVLCRTLLTQMLEFAAFFGTWLASGPHPAHRQAPTLNRYDRSLSARWHRPIPALPNRARTRPRWVGNCLPPHGSEARSPIRPQGASAGDRGEPRSRAVLARNSPWDPIAPASVSRDYRTTDREIHVSVTVPSSHPGRREARPADRTSRPLHRLLRCRQRRALPSKDRSRAGPPASCRPFPRRSPW